MLVLLLTAATAVTALPTDFPPPPEDLVPFLRYIVQVRAAEGLNRVVHDPADAKVGTVYGGQPEDANIAWVAAAAYRYEWSRFHADPALRDEALFLLDALATRHADGRWDDGGLDAYFGLHSFAWAVLEWLETGTIDDARAARWRAAVAAAADDAMGALHRSLLAGHYANPEFCYLAGLAAAWRITDDERYRHEAGLALHRYDTVLWPGGGVPYFHESSPEHGYQQMVVKSVCLYYDLTEDEHALAWLRGLAPYFPNVQHRSGLLPDAEQPWLKHSVYNPLNPAVPAMLACLLDDGANRWAADVATRCRAANVANRMPSFLANNPNWYNYHHTTYAAAALRLLEHHPLPEPAPLPARRLFVDKGFRGVRSHWDELTAAVGTRQMNDSLAGAYLTAEAEPMMPLQAAVDGVYCEVLEGDRGPDVRADARQRAQRRNLEWNPQVGLDAVSEVATVSCLSFLCSPHWGDRPWIPGERWRLDEVSDWTTVQHWAVWRDHLVGLLALQCHGDGGDAATGDLARVRWRLSPAGRTLDAAERTDERWSVHYGGLDLDLVRLAERGGFAFAADETEPEPRSAWSPVLARQGPWSAGDLVQVATDVRPATSDGEVRFKALNEAGAALLVEPGARRAYLWVASLTRHWRQHELVLPQGVTARLFRDSVELPPTPPGEPAVTSLRGAESIIWVLDADQPMDPAAVLAGLTSGWGRGESRPPRQ